MAQHNSFPTPRSDSLERSLAGDVFSRSLGAPLSALLFGRQIQEERAGKKRHFEEQKLAAQQKALLEAQISRARLNEFDAKQKEADRLTKARERFQKEVQALEAQGKIAPGTTQKITRKEGGGGSIETTRKRPVDIQQILQQLNAAGQGQGQTQNLGPGAPQLPVPGRAPGRFGVSGARIDAEGGLALTLQRRLPEQLQPLGVKIITGDATPGELEEFFAQLPQGQAQGWGKLHLQAQQNKIAQAQQATASQQRALKAAQQTVMALAAQAEKTDVSELNPASIQILNKQLRAAGIPPVDPADPNLIRKIMLAVGIGGPALIPRLPRPNRGLTNPLAPAGTPERLLRNPLAGQPTQGSAQMKRLRDKFKVGE